MVISILHTAAEIGIVLALMHVLTIKLEGTPLGAALAFVYGTGAA